MPTALGDLTVNRWEWSPESHKLAIDFEVAAGQVVHEADPVILNSTGEIQLAGTGASAETIIGVAMTDGAAGERVTVSMKAYTVVFGEATAALAAGPVELGAYNATTDRREFVVASTAAKTVGHTIDDAAADGDVIRVALLL